jgi:hypothetical protein
MTPSLTATKIVTTTPFFNFLTSISSFATECFLFVLPFSLTNKRIDQLISKDDQKPIKHDDTHMPQEYVPHIAEGCYTQAAKDDTIIWQQQPLEPLLWHPNLRFTHSSVPRLSSWADDFVTQVTKADTLQPMMIFWRRHFIFRTCQRPCAGLAPITKLESNTSQRQQIKHQNSKTTSPRGKPPWRNRHLLCPRQT